MSTTQRKSLSKSNSAATTTTSSGKTRKSSKSTPTASEIGRLLLSTAEIEQQLSFAVDGDLNQKHLQEVSITPHRRYDSSVPTDL